ncbi:MAG: hypothetical protein K6E53_11680 [Lachnospiraceae bacterium]|nr:hypothetical protein [Lachnospiraceae bacterium]
MIDEMAQKNTDNPFIESFTAELLKDSHEKDSRLQTILDDDAEAWLDAMKKDADAYINTKVEEDVAKARAEAEKRYRNEYGIAVNTGFHDEKYDDAFKGLLSSATGRMDRTIESGKNDMQALKEQIMKEQQFQREAQAFKQLTGW